MDYVTNIFSVKQGIMNLVVRARPRRVERALEAEVLHQRRDFQHFEVPII